MRKRAGFLPSLAVGAGGRRLARGREERRKAVATRVHAHAHCLNGMEITFAVSAMQQGTVTTHRYNLQLSSRATSALS